MIFNARRASLFLTLALAVAPTISGGQGAKPAPPNYIKDIKPLFKERCVVCHNRNTLKTPNISGGLALESFATLTAGIKGKPPLFVAGKSAEGSLIKRLVATSPALLMPKGGPPLSAAQIALVKRWIDAGAPTGDLNAEKNASAAEAAPEPLPANPALQDVKVKTRLAPAPDMRDKETPQNANLSFALKVGPLPAVTALAYSPDGKTLAVGTYRAVTLWSLPTGKPDLCLTDVQGAVQSLAYSPDGKLLAIAGGSPSVGGEVRFYDPAAKKLLPLKLTGHTDNIYSVTWSRDGKLLATGSHDKTARIWEASTGKETLVLKDQSDAVMRVCFAPDGKSIYTAGLDRTLRRINLADGKVIRTFSGHNDAIHALALSPDGRGLVTSGVEPNLRWWNPEDGATIRQNGGAAQQVNEIVFSADGKRLASADAEGRLRLWDAANGGEIRAHYDANDWLYSAAFSPDGKFVAGAGAEGVIYIWQTSDGRLRASLASWYPMGKSATIDWIAFTPEGYYHASADWANKTRVVIVAKPVSAPRLAQLKPLMLQSESVQKALLGEALEPVKIPDPATKTPPPVKPPVPTPPKAPK